MKTLNLMAAAPWADVVRLERHRLSPGEFLEHRVHEHVIALRLRPLGAVEMRIAGERTRCKVARPGDLCLFSQGVTIRLWHYREAEVLTLALAPSLVTGVADQTAAHRGRQFEFTNLCCVRDPCVRHMMLALETELAAGCPAGRLYGEALATALAVHLLQRYAVVPAQIGIHHGGLAPARLRRVLNHIEAHLGEDTSVRRLAQVAELSPYHFATLFKQSTGLSPHRYVQQRRMERAKTLLVERPLSLVEVAYALGFSSQAHFTTIFSKLVGVTLGAYRAGR